VAQEVFISFHRLHRQRTVRARVAAPRRRDHGAETACGAQATRARELAQAADESLGDGRSRSEMLEASEDRRIVRAALARLAPKPLPCSFYAPAASAMQKVAQAIGVGTGQIEHC